ncbi:MAG: hypothetical protein ACJ0IB_00220 [Verrucomicrobiales bacterium]
MKINCPNCGDLLEVPDDKTNRMGRCLSCNAKFFIPSSIEKESVNSLIDSSIKSESNIIHDEAIQVADIEPIASVSNGFLVRSIPALFFTSLGMLVGLFFGFYLGKSLSSNGNNQIMKMEMTPIINSNGGTVDPFGID